MNSMPFPTYLDSSMVACYKSCPEMFRKTYVEHWKAKEASVHLHAGAAFATGLEKARKAFYVGQYDEGVLTKNLDGTVTRSWKSTNADPGRSDDAIACGLGALLFHYGDFECPADSAKSAERMAGAFEFYFANYPLDDSQDPIIMPGGKRAIEFSFAEPIDFINPQTGDPLLYVGRMDAILNFSGGKFICDEKTTTQLGASWSRQWDLRSQFTGYAWGAQKAGIHVDGAIVRGVSILKTKYDTQQAISYRPEWQIDRWYTELLWWIEDIKISYETGRWKHNLDHACAEYGGCSFRQCCSTQDENPWLETYFERRKWNPVSREETKLVV